MSQFDRPSLNTPELLQQLSDDGLNELHRSAWKHCERQRMHFGDGAYDAAAHFSGLHNIEAEVQRRANDQPLKPYAVRFEGTVKYDGVIEACSEEHALECMRESFTMGIMYGDLTIESESVKLVKEDG